MLDSVLDEILKLFHFYLYDDFIDIRIAATRPVKIFCIQRETSGFRIELVRFRHIFFSYIGSQGSLRANVEHGDAGHIFMFVLGCGSRIVSLLHSMI